MVKDDSVNDLLSNGYECLKNADLATAGRFFDEALGKDYDNEEVLFAMKCNLFWIEQLEEASGVEPLLERGDFMIEQWRGFQVFLARITGNSDRALYAFKRMVFSVALDFFLALPDESKKSLGTALDFRIGRCRKALGDYETAIKHFERAAKFKKDDARFLAELADCYAISGDQRLSKMMFRDAFLFEPDKVDLEFLEAGMIRKLEELAREAGHSGLAVNEWIPVYGELSGILDIKRDLSQAEVARLNTSILHMENERKTYPARTEPLKPRLLNQYFRYIDYLKAAQSDSSRLEKVLLKIRLLDEDVYKKYVS